MDYLFLKVIRLQITDYNYDNICEIFIEISRWAKGLLNQNLFEVSKMTTKSKSINRRRNKYSIFISLFICTNWFWLFQKTHFRLDIYLLVIVCVWENVKMTCMYCIKIPNILGECQFNFHYLAHSVSAFPFLYNTVSSHFCIN